MIQALKNIEGPQYIQVLLLTLQIGRLFYPVLEKIKTLTKQLNTGQNKNILQDLEQNALELTYISKALETIFLSQPLVEPAIKRYHEIMNKALEII